MLSFGLNESFTQYSLQDPKAVETAVSGVLTTVFGGFVATNNAEV